MKILISIMSLLVFAHAAFAAADSDATEKAIRAQMASLSGRESDPVDVEAKLNSFPRAQVLKVLREELISGINPPRYILRAATILKTVELAPELKLVVMKNDAWPAISTVNTIFEDKAAAQKAGMIEVYQKRLTEVSPVTKLAVLAGLMKWEQTISAKQYNEFLADENFELREAAVKHFLSTRSVLPVADQVARFKAAMLLNPYQIRLLAMKGFLDLSDKERAELKSAVPSNLCVNEQQERVKQPCARVIASVSPLKKGAGK